MIYYDCTNYFFELEQADGLKQYGASKENRPLPIVQMGFFMDSDGIPLAFSVNPGNTNEQTTMVPLEKSLLKIFPCLDWSYVRMQGFQPYPIANITPRGIVVSSQHNP